jgi:hypothetical protein
MNLPVCPIRKVGSVHAAIIEQRGKGTSLCHGTFGSERTADGVVRLTNKRHTLDGGCWWSGLVWSGLVWSGLIWSGLVPAARWWRSGGFLREPRAAAAWHGRAWDGGWCVQETCAGVRCVVAVKGIEERVDLDLTYMPTYSGTYVSCGCAWPRDSSNVFFLQCHGYSRPTSLS